MEQARYSFNKRRFYSTSVKSRAPNIYEIRPFRTEQKSLKIKLINKFELHITRTS